MRISADAHKKLKRMVGSMEDHRRPWKTYWRQLADFILPRRYVELLTAQEYKTAELRNPNILDGTATIAVNTLSSGMMNGITSPARPWFRLKVVGGSADDDAWLDDCTERMNYVISESNAYSSIATMYGDLGCFATAAMMVYEDDEAVIRCRNLALGEFYAMQNEKGIVDRLAYEYCWRVEQVVNRFGIENVSERVRNLYLSGGAGLNGEVTIVCLIEPNYPGSEPRVAAVHKYRQICWESKGTEDGMVLEVSGYREWPGLVARWATIGNDTYGTGPSMDALGDIKQLQQMTKRKAQAMDKMVSPPMIADTQLQHQPTALLPNGVTYVSNLANNPGMKPAYQVQPPLGEMSADIEKIQVRIKEFFYNNLFAMISQLDTVRSAREIDARVEEKLILLGPVLERHENEVLDMFLSRVFFIMLRRGLFLPAPRPDIAISVKYVSILNDAQRAVGAAPIERYVSFVGNLAGAYPPILDVPNWDELTLDYADRLGVPSKDNHTPEEIQATRDARQQQESQQQMTEAAPGLAQAGKTLSETPVGGGADALSVLLGA